MSWFQNAVLLHTYIHTYSEVVRPKILICDLLPLPLSERLIWLILLRLIRFDWFNFLIRLMLRSIFGISYDTVTPHFQRQVVWFFWDGSVIRAIVRNNLRHENLFSTFYFLFVATDKKKEEWEKSTLFLFFDMPL